MKLALLFLTTSVLFGRVTATRLAPDASVWFEPNHGQVGGRTEWTLRAAGAWLFLTSNEVVYVLPPEGAFDPKKTRGVPSLLTTNVHMRMVGGRRVRGAGERALGGYSNYFLGKHEDEWFSGVPHFGQVRYPDVYPGIDVVYYATGRNVEYDFIVKPGAEPSAIELAFDGDLQLDGTGDLVVSMGGKSLRQHRPRVFQGTNEIEASYRLTERGTVKLDVGDFDPLVSLRVDPVLDFSTYLGGPGADSLGQMKLAADGNLVLAGSTQSPASPLLDPFQQPSVVSLAPIVLKMSADGRRILFYTILGRNGWDWANALSIAGDGTIVTAGSTRSGSFPTKNAFQTEFRAIWDNAWVARLSGDGRTLIYSSYMGGSNREQMNGMTLDGAGNAYFIGNTQSGDYPTLNPLQARRSGIMDAFLTRISPEGKILFSTYFGGEGAEGFWDVKWRKDGVLVLTGGTSSTDFPLKEPIQSTGTLRNGYNSVFLTILAEDGSAVRYSSFVGGSSSGDGNKLALDSVGRIYLVGGVNDRGYPTKNPLFAEAEGYHAFLTIFDRDGRDRQYSTLIPGLWAQSIELDAEGGIVIGGSASSSDFPVKDSFQPFRGGGVSNTDACLLKVSADGSTLLFSTILGGSNGEFQQGLVVAPNRVIYASGQAISTNFPVRNAYQSEAGGGSDAFIYRITDNSVMPAASAPFTVTPSRLTFRFVQGEALPAALPVVIGGLVGQVFAAPSVAWLRVTPAGLGVSGTMTFTVDPSGLPSGVHQGEVKLTPTSGEATSVVVTLTILAPAPVLSAVDPPLVFIGADDTEITLHGSGFTNKTTVQLQTIPWQLTPVRFLDSTTLKLTLPKTYFSAEYNHSITVSNPDSAVSKPVSLAVGRPAPTIANRGIVSAASYAGDVISPGEILAIFGQNFEPGMRVSFDGLIATPLYITPTQLSVVAPPALAGAREVNVIVEMNLDWRSTPVKIPVWPARPGLFTANASGSGQAAALNQDGSVNTPGNPAVKGEIIVLYGTGGGVEDLPVKVFIDGIACEVLYAGQAPGLIAGAWQLNVRIPQFASKGEVVWRAGERESVEGVYVALRE